MEYQKIHACTNDCILYKNEFVEMCKCPMCGVSRYKVKDDECSNEESIKKDPPIKLCWYFLIILKGLGDCLLTEMMQKTLHDM